MRATLAMLPTLLLPAAAPAQLDASGGFDAGRRLLSTYFFYRGPWDDQVVTSGGELGMSGTWKLAFPKPDDPAATIHGLDKPERWPGNALPDASAWPVTYHEADQYPLWLMAEWRGMKWSGFDFVLVDTWYSLCFDQEAKAGPPFEALAKAWAELEKLGEEPLPMAMFLETPFAWHGTKDGDCTEASADGIIELWEPTRGFLRQFYGEEGYEPRLPLRALARVNVNGEARPILQFWFPTWVDTGITKWNEWTFAELRRLCREAFGVEPFIGVNQHVHGREFVGGWNGKQPGGGTLDISSAAGVVDYDVAWWGGMAGPQIYPNAIVLGPGHWCPRQTGDKPVTLHWSAEYAPDSSRYEHCWRQVLSNPDSFGRKLLLVESWNNSDEGCAIAYSEPKDFRTEAGDLIDRWGDTPEYYMTLTRELAPYWREGRCPERFVPKP
ncbi:MAG TPA: hypothetical protein PLD23_06440 [Armatimonadota bacterium]|nr:hypothetical protein [Armatimonadota bacterium]